MGNPEVLASIVYLWFLGENLEECTHFAKNATSCITEDDHDLEEVSNQVGNGANVSLGGGNAGYVEKDVQRYGDHLENDDITGHQFQSNFQGLL